MDGFDIDQIMLDLLIREGFLTKETLPNGKIWYKRTNKQIPEESKSENK